MTLCYKYKNAEKFLKNKECNLNLISELDDTAPYPLCLSSFYIYHQFSVDQF